MTDTACQPLADHLARKQKKGLVDIKFFVHNHGDATVAKVCAEARDLFDAIEDGAVEEFHFGDSRLMVAAA